MEEKKKRGGKKEEPTKIELEFIHERFARGLTNSEILEDIQDELTLPRKLAFIVRRRKEFDVVKAILSKKAEGGYDADNIENRKKHWQRLSDRAEEILNQLRNYYPYVNEYTIVECVVGENLEFDSLLRDYRSSCLFNHLKKEYVQLGELKSWDDLPINRISEWDLINILGSKAEKGIFKGTCPVCQDWK
jgi:hypothetical protein